MGQSSEAPPAVRELIHRADPNADFEYCGALSAGNIDYFLFLLERMELAGIVLVQQRAGAAPAIVDADTSFFPFRDRPAYPLGNPIRDAIEGCLRRRNRPNRSLTPNENSTSCPEFSAVGREIDRVIYPISGFRFGSNSTQEILRLLRTGPTIAVAPGNAPPGSIIVSPTKFYPSGPIYLGHAGIVGSDGSIYSADCRYGGALTRNFSRTSWLRQFSSTNGSYAFVLHANPAKTFARFRNRSQITWLKIDP